MHEVSTSRRAVMRALIIAPSIIATPVVASAAPGLVCIPATQRPEWLALLAEERRLDAIFDQMVDLRNDAEERYIQARTVLTAAWQAEMDDMGGKPWKFVQARPGHEADAERTAAGIADYNAFGARMRDEEKGIREKARQEVGMADAEAKWSEACDAHMASFSAIIAFPSRDPDIIAHKMRMILDRYGAENDDMRPLLTSIVGEA